MADLGGNENEVFATLQAVLIGIPSLESYLDRVAWTAATIVDPPAWCGITALHGGWPVTVRVSDERARLADQEQYHDGEGPGLEAMRSGVGVVVDASDDEAVRRWGHYHDHAREAGIHSMLSIPLRGVDRRSVGVLSLYSDRPNAFEVADLHHAEACARDATRAVAHWLRTASEAEVYEGLERATACWALIEEAMGILMAQHRLNAPEAFGRLRDQSGNSGSRLPEVAREGSRKQRGAHRFWKHRLDSRGTTDGLSKSSEDRHTQRVAGAGRPPSSRTCAAAHRRILEQETPVGSKCTGLRVSTT